MIDVYQTKEHLNRMVDEVGNIRADLTYARSAVDQLRMEFSSLKTGHAKLSEMYAQQVEYFNELVPGFTEAFNARRKLAEVTRSSNESEAMAYAPPR